ncbi:hypothetical protein [Pedobacter frigoris]|uniref:Uncharacterized protein n=1 Tax=Pedobacter frigoris TaxID=2571272 RepID=A0A4U1CLR0_9SPHI|nr:hypothetical protein [Pedobacter frigoris]TKC07486.1 hypothetical protein FA047_09575 [Pedobacter frigoris]
MKSKPYTGIKKYRIEELLEYLTNKEYKFVMKILPGILGISRSTLTNYMTLEEGSPGDIPYQKVVALERFIGIKEGDLANIKPWGKTFRELYKISNKGKL